MRDTRDELVNDYTDGEIVENMGDVDFANDFAESLYRTLDDLKKECARVSADCIARSVLWTVLLLDSMTQLKKSR